MAGVIETDITWANQPIVDRKLSAEVVYVAVMGGQFLAPYVSSVTNITREARPVTQAQAILETTLTPTGNAVASGGSTYYTYTMTELQRELQGLFAVKRVEEEKTFLPV